VPHCWAVFPFMRRFALLSFIFIRNCLMLTSLLVCWAAVTLAQRISPTNVPTVDNGLRDYASLYTTAPGTGIVVATVSAEKRTFLIARRCFN
jgi:hypothetical protein